MSKRFLFCVAALVASLPSPAPGANPAPAPAAAADRVNAADERQPELRLKPEMSAGEVRQIMGEPAGIRPMKTAEGKAEVWLYRREFNERWERTQIGSTPIVTEVEGANHTVQHVTVGENPRFADVRRWTEETVQLLMFDDRYVTLKIARREAQELR